MNCLNLNFSACHYNLSSIKKPTRWFCEQIGEIYNCSTFCLTKAAGASPAQPALCSQPHSGAWAQLHQVLQILSLLLRVQCQQQLMVQMGEPGCASNSISVFLSLKRQGIYFILQNTFLILASSLPFPRLNTTKSC